MNILPKISIITPTYNASKYIEACIQSVCNQQYPNVEHVIVDGLSKDNTNDIVNEALKSNSHICFYSEKDKGIFDAMNKGISLSTGDFLYFLGADDVLSPGVLNEIVKLVDFFHYDLIYGKVKYPKAECGREFNVEEISKLNYENPFVHLYMHHQGTFIKKTLFDTHGIYDLNYPIGADVLFFTKVINNKSVSKFFANINIAFLGDEGASSQIEEMKLRFEFPDLSEKYLQIKLNRKLYYRNLAKYYFEDIRNNKISKGLKGVWSIIKKEGDFFYMFKNTLYWLINRNLK